MRIDTRFEGFLNPHLKNVRLTEKFERDNYAYAALLTPPDLSSIENRFITVLFPQSQSTKHKYPAQEAKPNNASYTVL